VTVPLERALSKLGLATRTEARALIMAGRIRVDGRVARDPLMPVIPERITLTIDEHRIERPERIVIAFHKPRGVVTTRRDPEGRTTVYDLLADLDAHVVAVGRLDFATSGLLLLTNDTRLADWLTDPANAVPRIYLVTVRGRVTDDQARQLERGIDVRGETLSASAVTVRKASARETHLVVELREGRNREVRRLMTSIGREVTRLSRVQFGGITLGRLRPGAYRTLDEDELQRAFPRALPRNNLQRRQRRS
jgi:23S rRNA pseudouridine2605 synthase